MKLAAIALAVAACGSVRGGAPVEPVRVAKLPPPAALDASAPGAPYLTLLAAHLQPSWASFLEDCRLRLPLHHPLNATALSATATLTIDHTGALALTEVHSSGNTDFDDAVRDVIADAHRVEAPPETLLGDDDRVTVQWVFARDRRQAGPATAKLMPRRLPLGDVVRALVSKGELDRAARRIASDLEVLGDEQAGAARLLLVEMMLKGRWSRGDFPFQLDVAGRAKLAVYAPVLHALLDPIVDVEMRRAAVTALARLHDPAAVRPISTLLAHDLRSSPLGARASVEALISLDAHFAASNAIRDALLEAAGTPASRPTLLEVLPLHALAPSDDLFPSLATWFAKGDVRLRAAVCAAIPATSSPKLKALLTRGLGDADATVRAACLDAIGRQPPRSFPLARIVQACKKDRDRTVRARATAVLATWSRSDKRPADACVASSWSDAAADVRLAGIPAIDVPSLRRLLEDDNPDVRAAAVRELARTENPAQPDLGRWRTDPAPQVRLAIAQTAYTGEVAAAFEDDANPAVATEAIVARVALEPAATKPRLLVEHLTRLANTPPASVERLQIALAWLLVLPQ